MSIRHFEDLLVVALQQDQPQRLLLVFARAGLPEEATSEQRKQFLQGSGGTLTPILCVDRDAREVESFESLVIESQQTGEGWDIAFASTLSGHEGVMPTPEQADQPLRMMVKAIQLGNISNMLAFDRQGKILRFL